LPESRPFRIGKIANSTLSRGWTFQTASVGKELLSLVLFVSQSLDSHSIGVKSWKTSQSNCKVMAEILGQLSHDEETQKHRNQRVCRVTEIRCVSCPEFERRLPSRRRAVEVEFRHILRVGSSGVWNQRNRSPKVDTQPFSRIFRAHLDPKSGSH
jgi:hypothetical protein